MSGTILLKPDANFRQFRLHLPDGKFIIAKETVRYPGDLQNLLLKFNPLNTYSTNATWLDPDRMRGMRKSSYKYADRIILDHLVHIDIDLPGTDGLLEVRKTLDFFKDKQRYALLRITSSGGGYHVFYKDSLKPSIANPLERLEWYKQERTALRQELEAASIKFDGPILNDVFRVSREVGTENWNSTIDGKPTLCKELSLQEVYSDKVEQLAQRKPKKQGKEPEHKDPSLLLFITNKIPGVKDRYIPILVWHKDVNYKRFLKPRLKLGRVHVFESGTTAIGISLKSVSSARLTKLLHKTRSSNIVAWEKYNHCWIPLAKQTFTLPVEQIIQSIDGLKATYNLNNFQIANALQFQKLKFIETIETSPVTYYSSEPHLNYLNKYLGVEDKYNLLHGSNTLQPNMVLRSK